MSVSYHSSQVTQNTKTIVMRPTAIFPVKRIANYDIILDENSFSFNYYHLCELLSQGLFGSYWKTFLRVCADQHMINKQCWMRGGGGNLTNKLITNKLNWHKEGYRIEKCYLIRMNKHHEGISLTGGILLSLQEISNQLRCVGNQEISIPKISNNVKRHK